MKGQPASGHALAPSTAGHDLGKSTNETIETIAARAATIHGDRHSRRKESENNNEDERPTKIARK
jgi:hypothetical protein